MDDRSFRLGDHGRSAMKKLHVILIVGIALSAVVGCFNPTPEPEFTPWSSNQSTVYSITFSPNDDLFAVTTEPENDDEDTRLVVVHRQTGRTLIDTNGIVILNPCFDQRSQLFAVFLGTNLVIYDLTTGNQLTAISRLEIFEGTTAALGFAEQGDCLVLDKFSAFGFEENPPDRITFAIPSGEMIETDATPSFWYGNNLSTDGSKWFGGGFHGPTPRVFHRNGDYIGHCYRDPNISRAWFSKDSKSLLSLHPDGVVVNWNLTSQDDTGALKPISTENCPELLKFKIVTPLHTQDALALIDDTGHVSTFELPAGIRRTKP